MCCGYPVEVHAWAWAGSGGLVWAQAGLCQLVWAQAGAFWLFQFSFVFMCLLFVCSLQHGDESPADLQHAIACDGAQGRGGVRLHAMRDGGGGWRVAEQGNRAGFVFSEFIVDRYEFRWESLRVSVRRAIDGAEPSLRRRLLSGGGGGWAGSSGRAALASAPWAVLACGVGRARVVFGLVRALCVWKWR